MARLTRRKRKIYEQILSGKIEWNTLYYWYSRKLPRDADKSIVVAWIAFLFAKQYGRKEDVNMKKLESIVARSKCGFLILAWAKKFSDVSNIKRFQREIIACGTHEEIRKFAEFIPGANKEILNNFALVKEIMESV